MTSRERPIEQLANIREWARSKIAQGSEPPWAWFQYMKLIETIDVICRGMESVIPMGSSPESGLRPGEHLRLVAPANRQDSAQRHPVGLPTQLPM